MMNDPYRSSTAIPGPKASHLAGPHDRVPVPMAFLAVLLLTGMALVGCGEDVVVNLGTPEVVVYGSNTPVVIPTNLTGTSTIAVLDFPITITKVTVTVDITIADARFIDIYLDSPIGTTVFLADKAGGSGAANYTNTTFDDAAATTIASGSPPYTGTFRPTVALTLLNGEISNGTWTLRGTSSGGVAPGSINSWSITFQ